MRADMSPDEFAREMLNSFDAPVEGAFYTEALNALQTQGRVCQGRARSEHQRHHRLGSRACGTCSASGCSRSLAASFTGSTISRARGKPLSHYTRPSWPQGEGRRLQLSRPLASTRRRSARAVHWLQPAARTQQAPQRAGHHRAAIIPPRTVSRRPGRSLGVSWFDETACRRGLARLRAYRRGKSGMAIPDEAEDAADAFRTGCGRYSADLGAISERFRRRRPVAATIARAGMTEFTRYRRKALGEARPYEPGESSATCRSIPRTRAPAAPSQAT